MSTLTDNNGFLNRLKKERVVLFFAILERVPQFLYPLSHGYLSLNESGKVRDLKDFVKFTPWRFGTLNLSEVHLD